MKAVDRFPDRHKKYFVLPSSLHVANIVDFPGFIHIFPKEMRLVLISKRHDIFVNQSRKKRTEVYLGVIVFYQNNLH